MSGAMAQIKEEKSYTVQEFSTRELIDLTGMKTEALRQYTFGKITEHEYESLMKILEGEDRDGHELAKLLMKEFRKRYKAGDSKLEDKKSYG